MIILLRRAAATLGVAALAASGAGAVPEGASWDHAGGPGRADCTACHFGGPAVTQSGALQLDGLPAAAEAGASYSLTLSLKADNMYVAGFVLRAEGADGAPAGAFRAADDRVQANAAAVRSTLAGSAAEDGAIEWAFSWAAPETLAGPVTFYVAANAGDDDLSPFGDQVHLHAFTVAP